ncbi:MAG: caspase family protein [Armatimonadota bacterium]
MKPSGIVALFCLFVTAMSSSATAAQTSARSEPVRLIPPIGHTRHVSDIQASRNGQLAASCSWDGSAIVWQIGSGRIIRRFPLTAKGWRVRFLDAGSSLLTIEDNRRIVLWDIESGKPRWIVTAPIVLESVSVRADEKAFAISGTDPENKDTPTTVIYQTDTGAVLRTLGASSEIGRAGVTEILYSPSGTALYGCSALQFFQYVDTKNAAPNALLAFDAATGTKNVDFKATGTPVAFSRDGKFLLTKGKGSAAWRDAQSGTVVRTFQQEIKGDKEPQNITLSPDSLRFTTVTNGGGSSADGTLREYSTLTGALLRKVTVHGIGPDHSLVYLPDRKSNGDQGVLVTMNAVQEPFCQVDIAAGTVVQHFRGGSGAFLTPTGLSADGKTVFLPNGSETGIIGWDVTKRVSANRFFFPDKKSKDSSPSLASPEVSRDGRLLVTPGISDEHLFVSDLRTNTVIADIPVKINALSEGIGLHPTGDWIAVPVESTDHRDFVKLFSSKGALLRELHPPALGTAPLFIRAVASDATGERVLISDYEGRLLLYDAESGNLLQTLRWKESSRREAIAFILPIGSEKDRILVTRDSGQAAEVDLVSGGLTKKNFGDLIEGRVMAAVTADGSLVALGRSDGSIVLWRRDASTAARLLGHTGRISSLRFSPDGRRLISLGMDGMVRFWDVKTGSEQAALLVYTQKPSRLAALLLDSSKADSEKSRGNVAEWIVYNQNGLFEGSDVATNQIHFAKGTQTYSAGQFFERFYHSGLLASVITDTKSISPAASANSILDSLRLGTPPLVRIVSPTVPGKSLASASASITVDATEQAGGGVKAIRLYHNGRLIGGPSALRGIVVEAVSGATTTKTFTVALSSGENTFRAVAYSKSDLESVPATLTLTYTPPQIVKPNLFVLTVGINTYKDSTMNLSYARPDAEALATFFETASNRTDSLFSKVLVTRLMDTDATGAAIAEKLKALAESARPEDVVFLYFAGHGETADNAWYFLPQEMRQMALPERVKEFGIPWARIEAAVGKIAARKVVLVVDACKSGAAISGALRGADDESQAMAVMARAQGIHILTAATAQQYAAEVKELGHGILTYALLEGLNGKATSTGGVFVRGLMSYVEDRVPALSKQYRGSEQYPVPFERGQNFPLVNK